jgi:hypothetical protein
MVWSAEPRKVEKVIVMVEVGLGVVVGLLRRDVADETGGLQIGMRRWEEEKEEKLIS